MEAINCCLDFHFSVQKGRIPVPNDTFRTVGSFSHPPSSTAVKRLLHVGDNRLIGVAILLSRGTIHE